MTPNRSLALIVAATVTAFVAISATLGTGAPAASQAGVVHGHVSAGPGQPVGGVEVIAESTDLTPPVREAVVANAQGRFVIPNLPEGEYMVWARGEGIRDCERETVEVRRRGPNRPLTVEVERGAAEWTLPNVDRWQQRRACSEISAFNVNQLEIAWTRELPPMASAYGSFASTPLVADGTVYLQDLDSNVAAVDLETGATKWTRDYDEAGIGPNGLTLTEGTLYGVTRTSVFALDPADGSERWRVGIPNSSFRAAPAVEDGRVYVVGREGRGGLVGALDAESGDVLWTFNTVIDPALSEVNAGGTWYTPLVGPDGGVYVGTGNAYDTPRRSLEDPFEGLYTNSLLKLDGETGELQWYFQGVPNDPFDWDMHLPPVYVDDQDEPVVLHGGKMGYVYAFDPEDGTLRWKTSVGLHTNHDDLPRLALEQPGSVTLDPPELIAPGVYGGVESAMAYQDGVVYVAIANHATTMPDLDINYGGVTGTFQFEGNAGEMVAIDVATGQILWSNDNLPGMALGAATISNDLVFTTTFDGSVFALSRRDGSVVWQDQLPSPVNAPVAIAGDTLLTARTQVREADSQEPGSEVVAYRLGASGP